ncbi:MAG TPA: HAD hydrolase-like protein [Polyangiales bacterium]|jgi:phosphoglycolate phosphatase|nr:HAD hydrolase-like protein [Polyangiales bacterium]
MIRHVVWDWNGTLLDDVDHALDALNHLLDARAMPRLGRDAYRERFGFPVRDFYVGLGFDLEREDFAALSETFIARYDSKAGDAKIHDDVRSTMLALRERGIAQSVLSALESTRLSRMLSAHGLAEFMTHVRGLDHLEASSKVALGVELARTLTESLAPQEILFVGDTLHDLETASAMGCECLLIVRGHQTRERLAATAGDHRLIDALSEVLEFVQSRGMPRFG